MTTNKSLGTGLILISLLLLSASFGHEYVGELMTASSLVITPSAMEVTPGSTVILNYEYISTWGTRTWNFNLEGGGYDSWSPKVSLDYGEVYYNSFSVKVPNSEGTVTYEITPYFYVSGHLPTQNPSQKITITIAEPQPETYDLTVKTLDTNSNQLPGVEVSINTGVIGTSDSTGTVTKSDLSGSYTVTGTKESYTSDSFSVSMTADRTVILQLEEIIVPTPEPTDPPTTDPTSNETGTPTPTVTPDSDPTAVEPPITQGGGGGGSSSSEPIVPITYEFVIEILDDSDSQKPIASVKAMINGNEYYSDSSGKISYISSPGEVLDVVITKEGYNNFQKSYTITSDTLIKVTLPASGGNFFLDFNLAEDNPFYDPHGLFGVVPVWVAAISTLLLIGGIYLLMKKE